MAKCWSRFGDMSVTDNWVNFKQAKPYSLSVNIPQQKLIVLMHCSYPHCIFTQICA